jgi:hypothetical protein
VGLMIALAIVAYLYTWVPIAIGTLLDADSIEAREAAGFLAFLRADLAETARRDLLPGMAPSLRLALGLIAGMFWAGIGGIIGGAILRSEIGPAARRLMDVVLTERHVRRFRSSPPAVERRTAELMARGFSEYDAVRVARREYADPILRRAMEGEPDDAGASRR